MEVFRFGFLLAFILVSNVHSLEELEEDENEELTNSWAVELDQDDESLAQEVAKKHGYRYGGRIGSLPNHFLLIREEKSEGDGKRGDIPYPSLREHPNVKWHEQQRTLTLEKRGFFEQCGGGDLLKDIAEDEINNMKYCNDPMFCKQWYIASYGQNKEPKGSDMGILEAWKMGYTGRGIKVTVMDDGLDHTHPDLQHNFDPKASFDLNDNDTDPKPRDEYDQYHGTKCSGEIGAQANNSICGVGLAPNVNLGGIRMLDGRVTGVTEAEAFGLRPDYIDIFSASWGPKDNGKTIAGPSNLGKRALENGAKHGRHGKGSIYVWASGNGGNSHDDCDCDGYASSIYTIAVGAISAAGKSTFYDEKCASTMAVVYSGDSGENDLEGYHNLITTGRGHSCLSHFGGTSAAAPLAAGVFSLVLEANKDLTWRDLQHLITKTAKVNNPNDSHWKTNGADFKINHKYGFGLLYAPALIKAAKTWKTVPKQVKCEIKVNLPSDKKKRAIKKAVSVSFAVEVDACQGTPNFVKKLEHVQAVINLRHRRRGVISIDIESPSKTSSRLLAERPLDKSTVGVKDWPFTTVHMWGENPIGEWKLTIRDNTKLHEKRLTKNDLYYDDNEIQERDEPKMTFDSEMENDYLPVNDESFEIPRPFRHEIELEDESEDEARQNFAREEDEGELNVFDIRSNIYGALDSWTLVLYGTSE